MAEDQPNEKRRPILSEITLRNLLEAGVHFGHQTQRWNPKMRKYIFLERNGIHIIDLQKSLAMLERARKLVRETVAKGGCVLFVGTKKQARDIIRQAALDSSQFYVTERWLGGMLTNFQTIQRSIQRLKELERAMTESTFELVSKKERLAMEKERVKLEKVFSGIKEMDRLPSAVFVVDTLKERIAVNEAQKLAIPVVGIVDTNCDPENVSHPIPGNDDALRSIQLLTEAIADAVKEGATRARDAKELAAKRAAEGETSPAKTERPATQPAQAPAAASE
jgi:small subunit ribosomal protein S2